MRISKKKLQEAVNLAIEEELIAEGPKMTRQHFQLIADVLKEYGADESLINRFAGALAETNPGFAADRFKTAAGMVHRSDSEKHQRSRRAAGYQR